MVSWFAFCAFPSFFFFPCVFCCIYFLFTPGLQFVIAKSDPRLSSPASVFILQVFLCSVPDRCCHPVFLHESPIDGTSVVFFVFVPSVYSFLIVLQQRVSLCNRSISNFTACLSLLSCNRPAFGSSSTFSSIIDHDTPVRAALVSEASIKSCVYTHQNASDDQH